MATKPVNPWNLDEVARYLHRVLSYLDTKTSKAIENDDLETVERLSGRIAYLSDKMVALTKVRIQAAAAGLEDTRDEEPDPFVDPRLTPEIKSQVQAQFEEKTNELALRRAEAKVFELDRKILDIDWDRNSWSDRRHITPVDVRVDSLASSLRNRRKSSKPAA